MWDVVPTLYWRVKRNGVWKYERTSYVQIEGNLFTIQFPRPPEVNVNESEE